jgi:tetratricopeptide (TPR) repeat protein
MIIDRHSQTFRLVILFSVSLLIITSCSLRSARIRRAELLYRKGQILLSKGKSEEALVKFQDSLSLAKEAGFKRGVAHNINEMAIIHTSKGNYLKARESLTEAIEIYKEVNMEPEISKSLNNIALTYMREHDFKEALNQYEALLEWDRKTHNQLGLAITLNNMGLIYDRHLGEHREAQRRYLQALQIFRELGKEEYIESVERNMGSD